MTLEQKKEAFSRAISSTMFCSELAYEIAYRWTGILDGNHTLFHHGMKQQLSRFWKAMKAYNGWVLRATGTQDNLNIIRNISDELNYRLDDELYKFRLSVENRLNKHKMPFARELAMVEIMYYTVTMANVCGTEQFKQVRPFAPNVKRFYPMRMDAALKELNTLRTMLGKQLVDGVVDLNYDGLIENGITNLIRLIQKNCNEVCAANDVEVKKPEEPKGNYIPAEKIFYKKV